MNPSIRSNAPSPRETTNKPSFFMIGIIWLLTTAIKFRKAGLLFFLAMFFINCYFMLFDQQGYIAFLEHYFSPDGNISNINSVFFKVQITIALISIFWCLIDQASIDLIEKKALHNKTDQWQHRPSTYITACIAWLLISYLPFLFLDHQTIINSIKEDGFYQNCGAAFLFISSVLFFYLFYKKYSSKYSSGFNKTRNIWFLLLSLLFFFGAGEEISWGQRIFHFPTPEFMSSNIQHEFSIHNLPWLDGRSLPPHINELGVQIEKVKTGFIEVHLTATSLLIDFCFLSLVVFPFSYTINNKCRSLHDALKLPIAPKYIGILFMIEYSLSQAIKNHYNAIVDQSKLELAWNSVKINHSLAWATAELNETFISFLFLTLTVWFINKDG